nr:AAA family ATPase [Limosilactobacillus mucosae]
MKFYEAGKIPPTPHMYFIYGDGGTGKTSLFKEFEGKKLVFSFDLSTNVLIGDESIDVFKLEERDMPVMQQELGDLLSRAIGSGRYQAICLDNVTALQNMVLENIDGASKDNRQNYQKLQLWFRQLGTYLRDSGATVYATAHQIDNGPDKVQGRFAADMNEKTFNAFTSMFDLVGRIYVKNGERLIDLDPEQGNHAKNRIDDRTLIKANELIKKEED